jgi:hypothetical protein
MTDNEKTLVQNLAIDYQNYLAATLEGNKNGIIVWGKMLLDSQSLLGVNLITPSLIRACVNLNEALLDA